jgi:hypothetical protein
MSDKFNKEPLLVKIHTARKQMVKLNCLLLIYRFCWLNYLK